MPGYRRALQPGGTYFFTVVTERRRPILLDALALLREAIDATREDRPFRLHAIVLLPDHLHCIWELPRGDGDFATRWRAIKARFTFRFVRDGGSETARSFSRVVRGERGVWQRRYWEHLVRDTDELQRLSDYIHYNPVRHGLAACPHAWAYSSFMRLVSEGRYAPNWNCVCGRPSRATLKWDDVDAVVGE